MASYKTVFEKFDDDKNGSLSLKEFKRAVHTFVGSVPDAELTALFKSADKDNNGSIDEAEFIEAFKVKVPSLPDLKYLDDFMACDADGSGELSGDEIAKFAAKIGKSADEVKKADADNNGAVSYVEVMALKL